REAVRTYASAAWLHHARRAATLAVGRNPAHVLSARGVISRAHRRARSDRGLDMEPTRARPHRDRPEAFEESLAARSWRRCVTLASSAWRLGSAHPPDYARGRRPCEYPGRR